MIRQLLLNRTNDNRISIMDGEETVSYRMLCQKAAALQQQLQKFSQGSAAVFLPDDADYIAAFYGVLMSGRAVFPLNYRLTGYEVEGLLNQASVSAVITSLKFQPLFEQISECTSGRISVIYMENLPSCTCRNIDPPPDTGADQPAVLLCTSGTTGNAKIVQLSERNLDSCILSYLDKMDFEKYAGQHIRYVIATPFFTAYGIMILAACIYMAFPVVLLKDGFTLDLLYRAVEAHRITHYEGGASTAILMDQLAGRPVPYDISCLKYLGFGGSKVSHELFARLSEAYPGIEFWPGYGMTEASPLIAKPYKRLPAEKSASVGTAINEEKILIEADGTVTDTPHTVGEIIVSGPNIMLGYLGKEEETRQVVKNGYLYTGDIGYLDEDGYLYICGRKKNIIIVRGFNVYPEEVEACILNSGLALDCRVYKLPGPNGSETVCADVIPAAASVQEEDIRAFLRSHLSDYKQPQQIRLMNRFSKTATGKNINRDL